MDILIIDSPAKTPAAAALTAHVPRQAALRAEGIPGVEHDGQGLLTFDPGRHNAGTVDVLARHLKSEQLAVSFQGTGRPAEVTDEDLAVINERHSAITLSAEDIVVFEDYAANDRLTSKPVRLTKKALEKFAADYTQGRTVQYDHDEDKPVGATFAAQVIEDTLRGVTANWLVTRWYAVTKDASELRRQRIQDMQTGVKRYTSVGLTGGSWDFQEVEGPDGGTIYFYEVDDDENARPRLESDELSRVKMGAVYGACDSVAKNSANQNEQLSTTSQEDIILCDW